MKASFALLLVAVFVASASRAEVITWTNTNGGNWNTPGNWSPNRVPSTDDLSVITNAGAYTVMLNTDAVIGGLILGGSSGTQAVVTAGHTLTLNGEGAVNANGCLTLSGGALSGTNHLWLAGTMTFEYGAIDTNAAVTVASGGTLSLASSGNHVKYLYGSLTNGGVVTWQMYGNLGIGGTLHNLAGALFDMQITNRAIQRLGEKAVIVNEGILRKSSGSGDLACGVLLCNRGTVNTAIGTLTLGGGSILQAGSTFIGGGQTRLGAGTHTLEGELYGTNLVLLGATVTGEATFNGQVTWDNGTIAAGAAMTIAAGSRLLLSSGGNNPKVIQGSLTNAGSITFSPYGDLGIGGTFHNLAGALFDVQTTYNKIGKANATGVLINDGVFRRSVTTTAVGCGVPVINNGTVEVLSGTLTLTEPFANPQGTISLAGGTLTLSQPLMLGGGRLTGWGTVQADVTNAACVRPASSNGVLTVSGSYAQTLGGVLELDLAGNLPGANQSRLNVTGPARLGGAIAVRWAEGYLPEAGTVFPVLTFASRQGQFCCADNFFLLGQGRHLEPVYSATGLTLLTVAGPEPAVVPLRVTVTADGGALVCWPVEFAGYALYWATNLAQPDWTRMGGMTNRWLETPPLARQKFYRLQAP